MSSQYKLIFGWAVSTLERTPSTNRGREETPVIMGFYSCMTLSAFMVMVSTGTTEISSTSPLICPPMCEEKHAEAEKKCGEGGGLDCIRRVLGEAEINCLLCKPKMSKMSKGSHPPKNDCLSSLSLLWPWPCELFG